MEYNSIMSDNFINSFCKVQFLCYEGEPNWLGLIVLFPLVIIVASSMLYLIRIFFDAMPKSFRYILIFFLVILAVSWGFELYL